MLTIQAGSPSHLRESGLRLRRDGSRTPLQERETHLKNLHTNKPPEPRSSRRFRPKQLKGWDSTYRSSLSRKRRKQNKFYSCSYKLTKLCDSFIHEGQSFSDENRNLNADYSIRPHDPTSSKETPNQSLTAKHRNTKNKNRYKVSSAYHYVIPPDTGGGKEADVDESKKRHKCYFGLKNCEFTNTQHASRIEKDQDMRNGVSCSVIPLPPNDYSEPPCELIPVVDCRSPVTVDCRSPMTVNCRSRMTCTCPVRDENVSCTCPTQKQEEFCTCAARYQQITCTCTFTPPPRPLSSCRVNVISFSPSSMEQDPNYKIFSETHRYNNSQDIHIQESGGADHVELHTPGPVFDTTKPEPIKSDNTKPEPTRNDYTNPESEPVKGDNIKQKKTKSNKAKPYPSSDNLNTDPTTSSVLESDKIEFYTIEPEPKELDEFQSSTPISDSVKSLPISKEKDGKRKRKPRSKSASDTSTSSLTSFRELKLVRIVSDDDDSSILTPLRSPVKTPSVTPEPAKHTSSSKTTTQIKSSSNYSSVAKASSSSSRPQKKQKARKNVIPGPVVIEEVDMSEIDDKTTATSLSYTSSLAIRESYQGMFPHLPPPQTVEAGVQMNGRGTNVKKEVNFLSATSDTSEEKPVEKALVEDVIVSQKCIQTDLPQSCSIRIQVSAAKEAAFTQTSDKGITDKGETVVSCYTTKSHISSSSSEVDLPNFESSDAKDDENGVVRRHKNPREGIPGDINSNTHICEHSTALLKNLSELSFLSATETSAQTYPECPKTPNLSSGDEGDNNFSIAGISSTSRSQRAVSTPSLSTSEEVLRASNCTPDLTDNEWDVISDKTMDTIALTEKAVNTSVIENKVSNYNFYCFVTLERIL